MKKKAGFTHDNKKNKTVDWWTPAWIFTAMGLEFDLDPCSPKGGISWIPTKKFYTEKDDGLSQKWGGRVWLNPPYGEQTKHWLAKMHRHRNGVALVFARTDCRWYHDYVVNADAILFLKGRIKFVDGYNETNSQGAGAGSMLIAWGDDNVKALARGLITGKFKGQLVRLSKGF